MLGLTALPGAAALAAGPVLVLAPAFGSPTSVTVAKGAGFPAGTAVTISFDSIKVASATASSAGGFTVAFNVPAAAVPEAHVVRAADTAGAAPVSATATFTVFTAWSSFRFSAAGTGLNPYENVLGAQRVPGLSNTGSFAAAGQVRSTPILIGFPPEPTQRVIFGADDGKVYAYDPASGKLAWSFATGGPVRSSPAAVACGSRRPSPRVIFGSDDGHIYGLDPVTGHQVWSFPAGAAVDASPTPARLTVRGVKLTAVLAGTQAGKFYALDACTGARLWNASLAGGITASAAVLSGVTVPGVVPTITQAVVGTRGGAVDAFNAATGAAMWSVAAAGPVTASPLLLRPPSGQCEAIIATQARAAASGGGVEAISCLAGAPLWSHPTAGSISGSPALSGSPTAGVPRCVIAGDSSGAVYCLSLSTGTPAWTAKLGGAIASSVSVAGGVAYIKVLPAPAAAGSLQALDVNDGSVLNVLPLPGGPPPVAAIMDSSVSVTNGSVLTGTWAGGVVFFALLNDWPKFHADNANDGNGQYEWRTGPSNVAQLTLISTAVPDNEVIGSPAVADGQVYVDTAQGTLYDFPAFCSSLCSPKWTAHLEPTAVSSPTVVNGVVYVGTQPGDQSGDFFLYAFPANCSNPCNPLWTALLPGGTASSPVVADGVVYVGAGVGGLYAFPVACSNPCNPLWVGNTGGIGSSPAVSNGKVFVTSSDGNLYAFPASCTNPCSALWTEPVSTIDTASPAVGGPFDRVVYVSGSDGMLHTFDSVTGFPLWTGSTGGVIASTPAVANGVVYVGSSDGNLYAFPASCSSPCQPLWTAATGDVSSSSSPAVANGVVYLGAAINFGTQGIMYAFPASCSNPCGPLWTWPIGTIQSPFITSPAVAYGNVYVGASTGPSSGMVFAFGR